MVSFFTKACCLSDDGMDNLKYISRNEELRNEEYYKCDNKINYYHQNINGRTIIILSDEQSQHYNKKEENINCLNPPFEILDENMDCLNEDFSDH